MPDISVSDALFRRKRLEMVSYDHLVSKGFYMCFVIEKLDEFGVGDM